MNLTGNPLDYVIVFGWGVLVSFTPCIYPVLPLTVSYIGGLNTRGTKRMGLVLSLLYVLGIAISYSALGVIAALSGLMFGQIQNHPAVLLVAALFFIFFSLVMFNVISIPTFGATLKHKVKIKNVWSVILFGMVSGLVVGSCVSPVLGGLLVYIAQQQKVLYGISLLFVFSYGMGASLILVGTFSGLVSRLPKSGKWLIGIQRACAGVLLLAGLYYGYRAMVLFVD
jgi:thiol:disulfide interchange protein DsbD